MKSFPGQVRTAFLLGRRFVRRSGLRHDSLSVLHIFIWSVRGKSSESMAGFGGQVPASRPTAAHRNASSQINMFADQCGVDGGIHPHCRDSGCRDPGHSARYGLRLCGDGAGLGGARPFDGNGWRNGRLPRKGLPETAIHRDHCEMLLAGHPGRLQRVFSSLLVEILHAQRTSDTRTVLLVGVITG